MYTYLAVYSYVQRIFSLTAKILHRLFMNMSAVPSRSPFSRGPYSRLLKSGYSRNTMNPAIHSLPLQHASSATASKQRVLENPKKFNPPSHGRRLKESMPRHYGPELTQEQRFGQETKQYPNMMPPQGSFMYWFLTSRSIHLWITMV